MDLIADKVLVPTPDAEKWPGERFVNHTWYRCQIRHKMASGVIALCWRYRAHPGDCLIVWRGECYDVSPNGAEDHDPRRSSSQKIEGIEWD